MRPNNFLTRPDNHGRAAKAEAPGRQRSSCESFRRRRGESLCSDIVGVEGEDPTTSGFGTLKREQGKEVRRCSFWRSPLARS